MGRSGRYPGGITFILVFVVVIAFVGADPAQPEGGVMRFPDIRAGAR